MSKSVHNRAVIPEAPPAPKWATHIRPPKPDTLDMDPSTAYQRQGISVPSETMGGQLTVELYQRWIPADPYSDYPEERVDHFDKLFVWIHDHGVTIDNARLFAASINALCDIAEAS